MNQSFRYCAQAAAAAAAAFTRKPPWLDEMTALAPARALQEDRMRLQTTKRQAQKRRASLSLV
jgi:hypothetical protein